MIERAGLTEVEFGPKVDTFGGAPGEKNARAFGTFGMPIKGRKQTG